MATVIISNTCKTSFILLKLKEKIATTELEEKMCIFVMVKFLGVFFEVNNVKLYLQSFWFTPVFSPLSLA